ncbi:peptidase S28 [Gongronella butleri]|nr:peptidase S28 [Gongronella butleri]
MKFVLFSCFLALLLPILSVDARPVKSNNVKTNIFTVPLDHYDLSNNATLSFRYWYNSTYYKRGGPVFLMNYGEDAVNLQKVPDYFSAPFADFAKSLNALLVLVEHRYYGESHPIGDKATDLRYLTVNQTLADMAAFIQSTKKGLPGFHHDISAPKTKWITRGGSYPGMLAAWMRHSYPDLVFATIASSAPVQLQLAFPEYNYAFQQYGPSDCVAALHNVVEQVDGFFTSNPSDEAKAQFKAQFGVPSSWDDLKFAADLSLLLIAKWQDRTPEKNPLVAACKEAFQGATDPQEQLKNYAAYVTAYVQGMAAGQNSSVSSSSSALSGRHHIMRRHHHWPKSDPSPDNNNANFTYDFSTLWAWQTCNEFGFYQRLAPPHNSSYYNQRVMTNLTTTQYFMEQCQQQFPDQAPSKPSFSVLNSAYQGWHLSLTNTIWLDGEWDPWRPLTVASLDAPRRTNTTDQYFILLPQAGHCFDYDPQAGYQNSLANANAFMIRTLKTWLHAKKK